MKLLRLAVVLVMSLAALLGTASLASAAPQPKLTPKQQQALCVAKQSVELLKAIDKQTWRDKKAREAAVKAIPAKAKAACPPAGQTPTKLYANLVSPAADEVVALPDGTYEFRHNDETFPSYPATTEGEQLIFTMERACPVGWTWTVAGLYTAENPANQGHLHGQNINDHTGMQYLHRNDIGDFAEPRGVSFASRCRPPA